jgi:hypothetical protein
VTDFNFPSDPVLDQEYAEGDVTYFWNGYGWQIKASNTGGSVTGAVLYDTQQALTAVEKTQARTNIYAAPLDALAFNGMQVNGNMDVSQQNGDNVITVPGYIVDGWKVHVQGAVSFRALRWGLNTYFPGIPAFLQVNATLAVPTLAAADLLVVQAKIEGKRVVRLNWGRLVAQPITLGFWTAHDKIGIYSATVRSPDGLRTYTTTYEQKLSNVAEYHTITIPGCTSGTWPVDITTGLIIEFCIAAGTVHIAPTANTWAQVTYSAAPGQVNGIDEIAHDFRISGVVVLPGTEAPTSEQSGLIMRPYDVELPICQRLFQKIAAPAQTALFASGLVYSATLAKFTIKVLTMRSAPTVKFSDFTTFAVTLGGTTNPASFVTNIVSTPSIDVIRIDATIAGGIPGQACLLQCNAPGTFIEFDSRL